MSKLEKLFEIPDELKNNTPKVTISGFDKLLIENYKTVLDYQDFFMRIKMQTGLININGFNLQMTEMTKDDLIITGIIESVDFERFT
jgi:YabP family.